MTNQVPNPEARTEAAYRAYLIGDSGRIASAIEVSAKNDDEAIRQAEAIDHGGAVELWDRGRIIFRHAPGEHLHPGC